ncbi:6-phosphogluconolactonase [Geobacter sp. SVR]|uniref:6-phosphogluconolactonase n=1 Tax=Geobacter sp. SVR TaxID=2495594 RepID=UPI00143F0092|nr:6-phosphogluconolactonase [Geobacter sp. SVR]BCS55043.1 6-phosphogluconolactonase [Geobacter sp. SVR]GCF85225.1 6-phosphogluconolactonase [Geobacter sp. SVR]
MIRVCADLESLSAVAAGLVAEEARRAVREKGRFTVALAGGGTPRRTYELLAQPPFRDAFPWNQTHIFWGDERCVAAIDPRNNARMAREALLDHVPIPPDHVHAMVCDQSPADSARKYEALLREFFEGGPPRFDLILLGLGEDGHTASLFPGSPVLGERQRWVAEVPAAEQGLHRLTLTAQVINQADLVIFLVSGSSKARALREVLEETPQPDRIPARLIRPSGRLLWLVDREAAKGLQALQREAK